MDGHAATPSPPEQESSPSGFGQQYLHLPGALQKRLLKQFTSSLMIAMFSIFLAVYFQSWNFTYGIVISLYLAYEGLCIIWGYYEGTVIGKRMMVLNANTTFGKHNYLLVSIREVEETGEKNGNVYSLRLYGRKGILQLVTAKTVLNVYLNPKNSADVIAWEIFDVIQ